MATPEQRMREQLGIKPVTQPQMTEKERLDRAVSKMASGGIGLQEDGMASWVFEQQMKGNITHEQGDEIFKLASESTENAALGAAVAPFTAAADLTALVTTILYNTKIMAEGGEWTWPLVLKNAPATSDFFGEFRGADVG